MVILFFFAGDVGDCCFDSYVLYTVFPWWGIKGEGEGFDIGREGCLVLSV